jgi:hypothetical protein
MLILEAHSERRYTGRVGNKFFPSIRGGHCALSYVTRGAGRILLRGILVTTLL